MSVESARMTMMRSQRDRAVARCDAAIDDAVFLREQIERIAANLRSIPEMSNADIADELDQVVSSTMRPRRWNAAIKSARWSA